ncbi:MAG: hypothetical protein O2854_00080 [Chloroflexi bacterium]|nr:hypothetical protein [Chloroflexota bacterium]
MRGIPVYHRPARLTRVYLFENILGVLPAPHETYRKSHLHISVLAGFKLSGRSYPISS